MIILGAGGHAKEVLDILAKDTDDSIYAYDDVNLERSSFCGKYRILHSLDEIRSLFPDNFFYCVAVGTPVGRRQLFEKFQGQGGALVQVQALTAIVSQNVTTIGMGANIMEQCFVGPSVSIGLCCLLNRGCGVHHDCRIGDFCEIGPGAQLLGHVTVGDDVTIGAASTVLPGVNIGNHAVVGAGAVVTREVSDGQTVIGVPAHVHHQKIFSG